MALQLSARRSSATLEQARQRLQQRFLQGWPPGQKVCSVLLASTTSATPETEDFCQAARERLRGCLAKWPKAVEVKADAAKLSVEHSYYLEEARQRIRTRATKSLLPSIRMPSVLPPSNVWNSCR
mmetsp:Transcript_91828/g.163434  ORF Transcript_91828/g.163434 Transcript_91828/m.163434 type:complete len:125 (+) Transcript_91828:108-482(+)|eukprot:CAMPEP_0197625898 /NCGR_PEP_ID=MMETSP1338-20131121/5122_1 /TAXON_ID=43686 ORGANISM="Pelagodinium beii, Strain RCC1491" /NCGR_SAMPLE_ID=MMETSP1338 /ASSEMBLY_ACC=CAM_ASM_000754 /LENGTH=124 /DNA_ID=CAMNT_0043196407 /DNA_START=91 /DNA_END=465 /DNA_ORIENTATION=-